MDVQTNKILLEKNKVEYNIALVYFFRILKLLGSRHLADVNVKVNLSGSLRWVHV